MTETKKKDIEVVIVSFAQYTDYQFVEPGSFFSMSAMQDYYFYKTSDRRLAQEKCDEIFGKGRYTVKTSKNIATKSKREDGGVSASGVNTRKGFAANLRKTV
jgi:hypothetical protein